MKFNSNHPEVLKLFLAPEVIKEVFSIRWYMQTKNFFQRQVEGEKDEQ